MTGFEELKYAVEVDQAMQSMLGHLWDNNPEIGQAFLDIARIKQISPINSYSGLDLIPDEPNNSFIHGMVHVIDVNGIFYTIINYKHKNHIFSKSRYLRSQKNKIITGSFLI